MLSPKKPPHGRLYSDPVASSVLRLAFAGLIGHATGSLACRLAGGLAFPAATLFKACLQVPGVKRLDFHGGPFFRVFSMLFYPPSLALSRFARAAWMVVYLRSTKKEVVG